MPTTTTKSVKNPTCIKPNYAQLSCKLVIFLLRAKTSKIFGGYCKNGENCPFAHGESELRSTPDLFKTAICNLWTQGKCNSGETCRFAHGYDDLRPAYFSHKKLAELMYIDLLTTSSRRITTIKPSISKHYHPIYSFNFLI